MKSMPFGTTNNEVYKLLSLTVSALVWSGVVWCSLFWRWGCGEIILLWYPGTFNSLTSVWSSRLEQFISPQWHRSPCLLSLSTDGQHWHSTNIRFMPTSTPTPTPPTSKTSNLLRSQWQYNMWSSPDYQLEVFYFSCLLAVLSQCDRGTTRTRFGNLELSLSIFTIEWSL